MTVRGLCLYTKENRNVNKATKWSSKTLHSYYYYWLYGGWCSSGVFYFSTDVETYSISISCFVHPHDFMIEIKVRKKGKLNVNGKLARSFQFTVYRLFGSHLHQIEIFDFCYVIFPLTSLPFLLISIVNFKWKTLFLYG